MIDPVGIIETIKEKGPCEYHITMNDYPRTQLRIRSENLGCLVYIKKEDWTDYTGWRTICHGAIDDVAVEIHDIANFDGEITDWEIKEPEIECAECSCEYPESELINGLCIDCHEAVEEEVANG